jgi:hypothetical protein
MRFFQTGKIIIRRNKNKGIFGAQFGWSTRPYEVDTFSLSAGRQ